MRLIYSKMATSHPIKVIVVDDEKSARENIRFKTEDVANENGDAPGTRVETLLPEFNE